MGYKKGQFSEPVVEGEKDILRITFSVTLPHFECTAETPWSEKIRTPYVVHPDTWESGVCPNCKRQILI